MRGPRARVTAILFFLLVLATVILSGVAAGPAVLLGDVGLALAIQQAPIPAGDALARGLTWFGGTFPTVAFLTGLALALLAVRGHRTEAIVVMVAVVLRAASPLLKAVIISPRPTPDLVRIIEQAPGDGFPSGHSLGATLFYGTFAIIAPAVFRSSTTVRVVRVVCVVMIALTGLARVRTGAHWPSDVLGGFLWGAILLVGLAALYARLQSRS